MDNIYSYVKWIGGFTFDERDFSEVDALVLSALCYYDLKVSQRTGDTPLTLRETYRRVCAETGDRPFYTAVRNEWSDDFCEVVAKSARYGGILVKNYIETHDHQAAVQFSAMTFEAPQLFNFIAFRGTDDTLAGWKEDFMISFTRTKAQEMALQYAAENINPDTINLIGGHSKGANLALYACAYLDAERWNRVNKVFLLDGPGFCPEVLDIADVEKVNRRALRIVPEFCVIGKLFEPQIDDTVIIRSSQKGLMQHDLFTWGVKYGALDMTDTHDEQAEKLNGLIDRWIENIDPSERETFINDLFAVLASHGALTVKDIMDQGLDTFENIIMKLLSGSRATRKAVAKLPEQALFGNTSARIKELGLRQWLNQCQIAKHLILFAAGLFFVLASDRALEITAMVFFLALTVIELFLTIRRLYQARWKISMVKERLYFLAALVAICIVIAVKDQALFMLGSLLYGIVSFVLAFRQLSKATDKNDDVFMRVIHFVETILLFFFGFTFLSISYDKIYGYALFVGILLMVDAAVRTGYRIYRRYHPPKPKPLKRNKRRRRYTHLR